VTTSIPVQCSGEEHEIIFTDEGEILTPHHPDLEEEMAFVAFGGEWPKCLQALGMWGKYPADVAIRHLKLLPSAKSWASLAIDSVEHIKPALLKIIIEDPSGDIDGLIEQTREWLVENGVDGDELLYARDKRDFLEDELKRKVYDYSHWTQARLVNIFDDIIQFAYRYATGQIRDMYRSAGDAIKIMNKTVAIKGDEVKTAILEKEPSDVIVAQKSAHEAREKERAWQKRQLIKVLGEYYAEEP